MDKLPIELILPKLKDVLNKRNSAVLMAQPGAGKTTRIPLALLNEPWMKDKKILMLQPRRLAVRTASRYMAALLGESVGESVGYRVKLDTKVTARTRIEVMTEGILTRILQEDPSLEGVGLVIFDEFHERNLHSDLGLALCFQAQTLLREDLRILIMSATLEIEPVANLLNDAPVLLSQGRNYPIQTYYLDKPFVGPMENAVASKIIEVLRKESGDILVFLPGVGEIRKVERTLLENDLGGKVEITSLYGNLSKGDQDAAISPSLPGQRKVVLSTSVAETSLTVEGVRVVIDSGFMRISRFSPRTGMMALETVPVSKASADQRRGRAGRLGPGVCYRLWTQDRLEKLPTRTSPEILKADLAPLALELAVWGVTDYMELSWLDAPPSAAFAQACQLLKQLGAFDAKGKITAHGRSMAELGLHPRLAHMVLKGIPLGLGELACEMAAFLNGRDFFRSKLGTQNVDICLRMEALQEVEEGKGILREAKHWMKVLQIHPKQDKKVNQCGLLLSFAYPDRIAQRKENGRFLMRNGRGAKLDSPQYLSKSSYLIVVEVDDQIPESRILLAAPLEWEELQQYYTEQIEVERVFFWDKEAHGVRGRERKRLGAIILQEVPLVNGQPEDYVEAVLKGIREEGLGILNWTKKTRQFQQRLQFIHAHNSQWPDCSDESLLSSLEDWLAPYLQGVKSRSEFQRINLFEIFEGMLTWKQRQEMDTFAPSHFQVPSGSQISINYEKTNAPFLAVKLQELFGLLETPCIAEGRVPLTLHILSPAQRPVQVTQDLASFWKSTYFEIKKDLKGRYPKHYWPEDPLHAVATSRTKPKK